MVDTSQSAIDKFSDISGDDNHIHSGEFSGNDLFHDTVVPGVQVLGWVSAELAALDGRTTILLGFDEVSFDKPVYVGDDVEVTLGNIDNGEVVFRVFTEGDICAQGIAKVTQV